MEDNEERVERVLDISRNSQCPPPQRRRLRACDSSRQRKIRCDNLAGSCRSCQTYGGQCVISRDGKTIPRSKKPNSRLCINRSSTLKGSPSNESHRRTDMSSQLSPDHSNLPSVSFPTPDGSETIIQQMNTNDQAIMSPQSHIGRVPLSENIFRGVVTTEVGHAPKNSKFAGITSPQVFAKSVEEMFKPIAPQVDVMAFFCPTMTFAEELPIQSPDQHPLVDKATADLCLHHFFRIYHVLLPALDINAFREDYYRFYETGRTSEPAIAACIYLVIALGCSDSVVADLHFRAACNLQAALIARPYMSSVQSLIFATLYLMNTGRDSQAHLNIGIAARIAQSIGLHRSLSTHNHPHEFEFVLKEHGLRSCIWWICYCLEKKLSFELGRPSSIRDDDCDADMPDVSHVFSPSAQAVTGNYFPEFFPCLIDICKKLSRICSELFSIDTANLEEKGKISLIENADTLLLEWRATLPNSLVPDQDTLYHKSEISSIATTLLNLIYLNAQVIVHRSSLLCQEKLHLSTHPNSRIASSDQICVNAARKLAHETNNLITEQRVSPAPRWVNPYAINAVMTIYVSLVRSPRKWSQAVDLALLRSMHHCFRIHEDISLPGRFETLTDTLIKVVETSISDASDNGRPPYDCNSQNHHISPISWDSQPSHSANQNSQNLGTQSNDQLVCRKSDFQSGYSSADQFDMWNFQLWPLVPLGDDPDQVYSTHNSGTVEGQNTI